MARLPAEHLPLEPVNQRWVKEHSGTTFDKTVERFRPIPPCTTIERLARRLAPNLCRPQSGVGLRPGDPVASRASGLLLGRAVDVGATQVTVRTCSQEGSAGEVWTHSKRAVCVHTRMTQVEVVALLHRLLEGDCCERLLLNQPVQPGDGLGKRHSKVTPAVLRNAYQDILEDIMFDTIRQEVQDGSPRYGPGRDTRNAVYFPSVNPKKTLPYVFHFNTCGQHMPKNTGNRIVEAEDTTVFDYQRCLKSLHDLGNRAERDGDAWGQSCADSLLQVLHGSYDKQSTSVFCHVVTHEPLRTRLLESGAPEQAGFLEAYEDYYLAFDQRGITPALRLEREDSYRNLAFNLFGHHLYSPKPIPDGHVGGLAATTCEGMIAIFDVRRAAPAVTNTRWALTTDISESGFQCTAASGGVKWGMRQGARLQSKNEAVEYLKQCPIVNAAFFVRMSASKIYRQTGAAARGELEPWTRPDLAPTASPEDVAAVLKAIAASRDWYARRTAKRAHQSTTGSMSGVRSQHKINNGGIV